MDLVDLPLWARVGTGIGLAAALAYVATPVAIQAARRFDFYDLPRGYKGHARPTPYLGGTAVMIAFGVAVLAGAGDVARTLPVLGGVTALLVLGTVDDRRTVSPLLRVIIEFGLGALLAADNLGWRLGSGGWVDAVLTGLWVVAVVNAFNLFDNMDGAASSMALTVMAGACALAIVTGDVWVAAGSAAMCGACLGFLPHNLSSPAKVFLGDGGSMPLGFAVAVLVANAARSAEASDLGLLVGVLLVGVPAIDTSLVIVSRLRRGVSVLTGGQDHLTHRTRRRMRSTRRVALVLCATQAVVSGLVILASREGSATLVYIGLGFVVFAAAAIIALEDALTVQEEQPGSAPALTRASALRTGWTRHIPRISLALLGLGAGISPLFSAYYSVGVWIAIGLVMVLLAAMALVADPPRFAAPTMLTLAGLAGLGIWSLLSSSWAGAVEQSTVSANLWLSYAAVVLLAASLIRSHGHASWLLISIGTGIAIVGLTVLARMLGSGGPSLFLGGRLNAPLGYINGEGCVFAMGCWLSLALAERRQGLLAGLGAAATVAMACLTLLSQSRGAAIATLAAIIVALAAVPGFRRRVLALATIAGGVAIAAAPVVRVYSDGVAGAPPAPVVRHAALAILAASAACGLVWGLIVAAANRVQARGGPPDAILRRTAAVAATCLLAAPLIPVVVRHSTIEREVSTQWHAFTHVADADTAPGTSSSQQTRLFSGAGNRYDYWRVAWHAFLAHPAAGVGAGNYPADYFRQRRTQEAIQNPHSIELQTLVELGLVGALLLALAVGGAVLGARRLRAAATRSAGARAAMLGATGVAVVWFVDTSGDWMHLLPGVSAAALCAVAVLCRGGRVYEEEEARAADRDAPGARWSTRREHLPRLIGSAAVVFTLAVGGASLLRSAVAQRFLDDARAALAAHPAAAVSDAQRVLRLDQANLDAYYVQAAGQARFDEADAARTTLLEAAHEDPGEFVTWTLLGDLEVRAGDLRAARSYYRRALSLDPREPALKALVANPSSGLQSASQ